MIVVFLSLATAATLATATQAPAPVAEERTRSVTVAVLSNKGVPVDDLVVSEVQVTEGGQPQKVLGLERDRRPLFVALLLDSSEPVGALYRGELVDAAVEFWKALPPEARLAVWTTGTAPSKVVDFGTDLAAGEALLKQVAPGGGNLVLNAMSDAMAEIAKSEPPRRVVVAVTSMAFYGTTTLLESTYETITRTRVTPMVILFEEGTSSAQTLDAEAAFKAPAAAYGGIFERSLSASGSRKLLQRIAADLSGQYRVQWATRGPEAAKLEVKVSRKGVKARIGHPAFDR